jgi:hypothetical protein
MAGSSEDPGMRNLVQSHLDLIQRSIDKYDEFDRQIKSWAVTLWVATIASGLVQDASDESMYVLIGISIIVLIVMGIYDNMYKIYREGYKKTREDIASKLRTGSLSTCLIYFPDSRGWNGEPLNPDTAHPKHILWEASKWFVIFKKPHISLMYLFLIFVSFIVALLVKLDRIPGH